MKATSTILDKIPNCLIDPPQGIFKYIQIYVRDIFSDSSKFVIRGHKKHGFHADNYEEFANELVKLNVDKSVETNCVGGGRLNINKDEKTIFVYGYSQSYGQCDHQLTSEILKQDFGDYTITWSNKGY